MNQFLKGANLPLFKLSQNLKHFSNFGKEITKSNYLAADSTDLLINNLKNAKSINGLLDLVNIHYKVMNPNHTIQALKSIFELKKQDNVPTSKILKHPTFEKICTQLKYHAGAIDLNETIDALKVMNFFGVSSDSTIYQILLQLIRHNINQMSLQQIIFLDFILSKATRTPLIEAIQIALPIVYDAQLQLKLDKSNANRLAENLQFISKKKVSEESITLIVNSLMKAKVFDARTSVSILWSICDMEENKFFEPLLKKALKSLEISGYDVSYQDLETTLTKLSNKYNTKSPFYYNEAFFDHCADVVINEDLGFEVGVHLLKRFLRLSHMRNDLLDYISEKCFQNPDLITFGDPIHVFNIICGCALTDFRPKYYESIKEAFLKIKGFNQYFKREIHLVRLQMSLTILDIDIPEIMARCFGEDDLNSLLKKKYWLDFESLLIIMQAIETMKPEYRQFIPNKVFINKIKGKTKTPIEYPLTGSLHHVFGGETYVRTQIYSKMHHHIDHLILLSKNGMAAPINSSAMYIEDIQCNSPSQLVLIMVLNHVNYTINCQRLKGHTDLMLKTLEAQGYTVVPICLEAWKSLLDFEKIPYIMEAIKTKSECYNRAAYIS